MPTITRSVTVRRPRAEVYRFWRHLENLPTFMINVERVHEEGRRSRWTARGPMDKAVEWDAELTADVHGELLSWRSLENSDVTHDGTVRFRDAPGDRGTEVHVELTYDTPGGRAGGPLAALAGSDPDSMVRDDLRRFKQVMEAGEVVLSDGSQEGLGQGPRKQRPASPESHEATS